MYTRPPFHYLMSLVYMSTCHRINQDAANTNYVRIAELIGSCH